MTLFTGTGTQTFKKINGLTASMKNYWQKYPPGYLVDGKYNNFAHTYTVNDGIWIRVKLPEVAMIQQIKIHNRGDCCKNRIVGMSVFIKMQEVVVTSCGNITEVQGIYTFDCSGRGDVVELSKDGDVVKQNIAEIEIFRILPGYNIMNYL